MATRYPFALPTDLTGWTIDGQAATHFTWDYDGESADLLALYAKSKRDQWDASARIDWSLEYDPEDPMKLDERLIPLYGTEIWERLSPDARREMKYHSQVFSLSNFMHGEQGALVCAARIAEAAPTIEAKLCAATQVMDEARHVEVFSRLLRERYRFAYPITKPLRALLDQTIGERRWDFTFLSMQVLIEGLAMATFQRTRDHAKDQLCASVHAYVMQDEARHVAFGRLALRDYYLELTEAERREREDLVIEGCHLLGERLEQWEVWENLGLSRQACVEALNKLPAYRMLRQQLFSRIVPTLRSIGLFGERVQRAFVELGVERFATTDVRAQLENDVRIAGEFDALLRRPNQMGKEMS
jgi:1,2-phenylacetyl-CoA epoxidase catalytic subunit